MFHCSWTCTYISCSFCYIGINHETTAAGIVSDGTTAAAGIFSDETYDPYLNTKLIHDPYIYVDWKKVNRVRKMMSVQTTSPTTKKPVCKGDGSSGCTKKPTKAPSKKPVITTKKPACKGDGSSGCTKKPVTSPPKKKPTKAPSKKPVITTKKPVITTKKPVTAPPKKKPTKAPSMKPTMTKKPVCKGDGSSGCTKKPVTKAKARLLLPKTKATKTPSKTKASKARLLL